MQGRDPRDAWAFTQRICGVCTVVHAVASCRAVEDALDITIPPNANLIRNLIHGMQFIQDHVIHFYHLHALDWVDVVSALKADPAGTAAIARKVSPWPNNSETYFRGVQDRLKKFVAGGPARDLHQRLLGTSGLQAAAGSEPARGGALPRGARLAAGRDPAAHDLRRQEPAPELPGGRDGLCHQPRRHRDHQRRAADRHPRHDHPGPGVRGAGLLARHPGHRRASTRTGRRSAAGCRTTSPSASSPMATSARPRSCTSPGASCWTAISRRVWPYDQTKVKEYITSSWYEYSKGDDAGLHPYEGETTPKYTGPPTPWKYLQDSPKYTWMKAPRYDGRPMEVGPLARALVGYRGRARGHPRDGQGGARPAQVGPEALFSTLGRVAARGMETVLLARRMNVWYDRLVDRIRSGDTKTFNGEQVGAVHLAGEVTGLRLPRRPARRPRPLGADRERQDLPLPVRRAQHLELLAPRRAGPDGPLRGRAGGQPPAGASRSSRWRSSGRSTRSTPAWPAASTCWTRTATGSPRSRVQ